MNWSIQKSLDEIMGEKKRGNVYGGKSNHSRKYKTSEEMKRSVRGVTSETRFLGLKKGLKRDAY